jgi:hypothetical protein
MGSKIDDLAKIDDLVQESTNNDITVEGFDDTITGGKKSRKRSKKQKRGKKRKSKKTKRRRRKQKGGTNTDESVTMTAENLAEIANEVDENIKNNSDTNNEEYTGGRKRKGKKGTKKKGKAGKWIAHVKAFAKSHKIKFPEALKHPACKKSYKKM